MNEQTPSSVETTVPTKIRQPLDAALLSLCMPGLGHLYCGQVVATLWWAAASTVAGLAALWMLAHQHIWSAWFPSLIVQAAAATSAWYVASACPRDYQLQPWNRPSVYMLFLLICSVGGLGHALVVRDQYVEAFIMAGDSMAPTLNEGDRILVDKAAYKQNSAERYDIVVFANPEKPAINFVKRIVALSGDRVQITDGQLFVNDKPVGPVRESVDDFGPVEVPDYNCFVIGDNVANSKDSRHFGPVPDATVKGRATTKYWPPVGAIENGE